MKNISLKIFLRSSNINLHIIYTSIFGIIFQLLTAEVNPNKMRMLFC